ncbi:hypothetical protein [Mycolicibacterium bacteremicum]|uniref:hypothetical protein n=1 Tax=Mycolicibacterium bacteremicum TaxID=564198 RepID=UPI0026F0AA4F|nr:hypothetical protein [Mycolicibacterium bacteremicum]
MSKRAEYIYALYLGSVAEPGDRNPFDGRSVLLAKLWQRGYRRMVKVRINTGPARQRYLRARRSTWIRRTAAPAGRLAPRIQMRHRHATTDEPPY